MDAARTISGVSVAVGAGGGAFCGGVCSLPSCFLLVTLARKFRRGGGDGARCGCAIEFPSRLKKSPTGLLATERSPAKHAATDAITTILLISRSMTIATMHVRSALFKLVARFCG